MAFFSLILTPKDVNSCLLSYHSEILCEKCGIEKTIRVNKPLRLTMAVLDIDYGAFHRRNFMGDFRFNVPKFVEENRFKFTLKIKSSTNNQEVIICHLHEGNQYQSKIDVHLDSGSSYVFSCHQTCSIHLIGYYLN